MKLLKLVLGSFVSFFSLTVLIVSPASAATLYDDFNSLPAVNPDNGGNWWVLNTGLLDSQYYVYNDYCGDGTCVLAKSDSGTTYASLEQYTTETPGNYYDAELAEEHTGFFYGQPTVWNPSPGEPVTMETRVRWSANHQPDGSGGAVGSSGIWLWNSPIDYVNFAVYPQDGIGFNWVNKDSSFAPGLSMGMVNDSFPVFQLPLNTLNMQDWNTFKFVWSVDAVSGLQFVDLYVNEGYRGHHPLLSPMHDLSVEMWSDNQMPVDMAGTIGFFQPTATQTFEVDSISVSK